MVVTLLPPRVYSAAKRRTGFPGSPKKKKKELAIKFILSELPFKLVDYDGFH